ncbi:MAG: transposase family protein [Thermoplasmata archaeon]|nr:transposase family protein [Thermoplasmata archaeon]
MDIKELEHGRRYLFTIMDDHSRFIIASRVLESVTTDTVLDTLDKAVKMFGPPRQVLTDHGSQF